MRFQLLGPLTVSDDDHQVPLGGTRQRATLGVLLLQANQVVATSKLLRTLWSVDDAPSSARKILQNSVWSLRTLFAAHFRSENPPLVRTQAPGYILCVDSQQVDSHVFAQYAEQGRAKLATAPAEAAGLLREALSLWRGPALADLVETGIVWPELAALQNARLDALEDLFEAELACGRHQAVLSELEILVETECLRERACEQLMLALYRCGRHADALAVFAKARTALVDLGLEPGWRLRNLQQSILSHDPALSLPERVEVVSVPRQRELPVGSVPLDNRRVVSVLLIRAHPAVDEDSLMRPVDARLDAVAAEIRRIAGDHGGAVVAALGSTTAVLFDGRPGAERAVRAAGELRSALHTPIDASSALRVTIAVVTDEAGVHHPGPGGAPVVAGGIVECAHRMLATVPDGHIELCPQTKAAAGVADDDELLPFIDREREMALLGDMLNLVRHRCRPHLVTVLGDESIGKTRLLREFTRTLADEPVHVLHDTGLPGEGPLAMPGRVLSRLCGITDSDEPAEATAKLTAALGSLVARDDEREWLGRWLRPFVDPPGDDSHLPHLAEILHAWCVFLADTAVREPVVLIFDDLHVVDAAVQDALEGLAESARAVPMLVVVSAHPGLLRQRPGWGGGKRYAATITLDPLSDAGVERMLQVPATTRNRSLTRAMRTVATTLLAEPEQDDEARRLAIHRLVRSAPQWAVETKELAPSCGKSSTSDGS